MLVTFCLLALLVSSECASLMQSQSKSKPKTIKLEFRMMNDVNGRLKLLPINVENVDDMDNGINESDSEILSNRIGVPERFEAISQVEHDIPNNSIVEIRDDIENQTLEENSQDRQDKSYMVPDIKMFE